jgi:hypothetical protein
MLWKKDLLRIRDRFSGFEQEIEKSLNRHAADLDQEKQTRASEDNDIRAKLEISEAGGLHVAAMEAVWLGVGMTMSTMSIELEKLFAK